MMTQTKDSKTGKQVFNFSSISAYGDFVGGLVENEIYGDTYHGDSSESNAPSHRWCLSTPLKQAVKIAREGGYWEKGAKELQSVDLSSELKRLNVVPSPELENDCVGGAVDIGAYLADDPECMFHLEEQEQARPVVKIAACISCGAGASAKHMMNRGRAIIAIVDALEANGYTVQLDATQGRGRQYVFIAVKNAGEHWDAPSAAYTLAHMAVSRRLGFRHAEGCKHGVGSSRGGYGSPYDAPQRYELQRMGYDVEFPKVIDSKPFSTPERALMTILRDLRAQAPDLLPAKQ